MVVGALLGALTDDAQTIWNERFAKVAPQMTHDELHAALGSIIRSLRSSRRSVCLHAGATSNDTHGVLVAGATSAGKSTLTLALSVFRDFDVISDDTVWCESGRASGIGAPLAIRRSSPWFEQLRPVDEAEGERVMALPEQVGGRPLRHAGRITHLVFPDFVPGAPPVLTALTAGASLCRLATCLLTGAGPDELLELAQLASDCPGASVSYGSTDDALALVDELLTVRSSELTPRLVTDHEITEAGLLPDVHGIVLGEEAVLWRSTSQHLALIGSWDAAAIGASTALDDLAELGFAPRTALR